MTYDSNTVLALRASRGKNDRQKRYGKLLKNDRYFICHQYDTNDTSKKLTLKTLIQHDTENISIAE